MMLSNIERAAEAFSRKGALNKNKPGHWINAPLEAALDILADAGLIPGDDTETTVEWGGSKPEIVCLCGSTRFVDEFNRQRVRLTHAGAIVLSIEIVTTQALDEDPQHVDHGLKARLDELHKRKIDLADKVLVLNVGGYIGESTRSEIDYAKKIGRPVSYLQPVEDTDSEVRDDHSDPDAI
jgi:hypothetical protein